VTLPAGEINCTLVVQWNCTRLLVPTIDGDKLQNVSGYALRSSVNLYLQQWLLTRLLTCMNDLHVLHLLHWKSVNLNVSWHQSAWRDVVFDGSRPITVCKTIAYNEASLWHGSLSDNRNFRYKKNIHFMWVRILTTVLRRAISHGIVRCLSRTVPPPAAAAAAADSKVTRPTSQ